MPEFQDYPGEAYSQHERSLAQQKNTENFPREVREIVRDIGQVAKKLGMEFTYNAAAGSVRFEASAVRDETEQERKPAGLVQKIGSFFSGEKSATPTPQRNLRNEQVNIATLKVLLEQLNELSNGDSMRMRNQRRSIRESLDMINKNYS